MKIFFYKIWVDIMVHFQKHPVYKNEWKFYSMFTMTLLNFINVITIYGLITVLGNKTGLFKVFLLQIDFFPGEMLNNFFVGLLQFGLPIFIVNYYLIYYNDKYKNILKNYSSSNRRLIILYSISTISLFLLLALLYNWYYFS